eukprot:9495310-Pyramimonas_sp.AAC.1
MNGAPFPDGSWRAKMAKQFIADGWSFCCVGFKGDHPAAKVTHDLPRTYQCAHMCMKCCAVNPKKTTSELLRKMTFADASDKANWRDTL